MSGIFPCRTLGNGLYNPIYLLPISYIGVLMSPFSVPSDGKWTTCVARMGNSEAFHWIYCRCICMTDSLKRFIEEQLKIDGRLKYIMLLFNWIAIFKTDRQRWGRVYLADIYEWDFSN